MCRTRRGSTQRQHLHSTIDYGGDLCDEDFIFRSDSRFQHLLALPKGVRKQLIDASVGESQQLYLFRKAEEKALKLARKNKRLSVQHFKGHRRKTCRLGVGKSGSHSCRSLDDEALMLPLNTPTLQCMRVTGVSQLTSFQSPSHHAISHCGTRPSPGQSLHPFEASSRICPLSR